MNSVVMKLGEACIIKRGTTITQKQAIEGDIPVVAGGLKPTYYHNQANRFDTTITVSGSGASAGFVNLWKQPIFASDCSTVEVKDSNLDINYVYYFLLSKQDYIYKKLRSGAAQPHVYGKDIAEIPIPIPSLQVQQKVVSKLETIFSELTKSTLAAKSNIKNSEVLFHSYLNNIFEITGNDWDTIQIAKLGRVQSGGTPLISKKEYWGGNIEWYSSGELNDLYTLPALRTVTTEGIKNSNAKIFPANSLLIGMYDTAAMKMSLLSHPAAFNQAIVGIEPNENINMTYLYYALSHIKPYVLSLRRGVRQKNLSLAKIKDLVIKFPSFEIQNTYAKQLTYFSEISSSLESCYIKKVNEYELLKQSILQNTFNELIGG